MRVTERPFVPPAGVDQPCPCGRDRTLALCCMPLINQSQSAQTAEELMRSRYTAHVLMHSEYLLHTWCPTQRPKKLTLPEPEEVEWIRLEVHRAHAGQPDDLEGLVEYTALSRAKTGLEWLRETARFTRVSGAWLYVDGVYHPAPKIGRNTACPCGSGVKYKRCCGR